MQEAMGAVIPQLEILAQTGDTPEEERLSCARDLEKLRHATEYYSWLQQFVDGLKNGELFGGPVAEQP